MKKKHIKLSEIVVENIDPFLPKNQIVESAVIGDVKVTLYYHYKRDAMMVKAVMGDAIILHELGARGTYNEVVSLFKELIN